MLIEFPAGLLVGVIVIAACLVTLAVWLLYSIRRSLTELHRVAETNLSRVVEELRVAHEKLAALEITTLAANMHVMALELERVRGNVNQLADAMSPYIAGIDLNRKAGG